MTLHLVSALVPETGVYGLCFTECHVSYSFELSVDDFAFKMTPKHSAEVLSSVPSARRLCDYTC